MPIALPGPDAVPAGHKRNLVVKLHDLYAQAGKPATRIISRRIDEDESGDLEAVSHETINSVLRGKSVPSWNKLKSIITVLCRMSVRQVDVRAQLVEFNTLWVRVDALRAAPPPSDEPDVRPQLPSRPLVQTLPALEPVPRRPPAGPVESRLRGDLPERSEWFTGRENVLDEIEDRLRRSPETPLVLHAPIGAGKSQLAAEYVRQHRGDYAITWWVPAGDMEQVRQSLLGLAHDLGVAVDGSRRPFDSLFGALTAAGPYLLVFDGVLSPDVRPLTRALGGSVIVTTRNPGWAQESLHDAFEVPDLDRGESAQLLRKHDPRITPEQVDRLIQVLGRSPLGLTAAGRLHSEGGHAWEDLAGGFRPGRSAETVRSVLHSRAGTEPGLVPLLTLLLGFGPSPVGLSMLQRGADGDVSPAVRRILGDPANLRRTLQVLAGIGLARRPAHGEWVEVPAFLRLILRELMPNARGEINRRDVIEILVRADPAYPEDPRTAAGHRAITPHLRPAAMVESFRPSVYRTVHHQIRFLFLTGDLPAAQQLGRAAEEALARQNVLAPTDDLVLQIKRDLANALRADGRYQQACRVTEEAMKLLAADETFRPDHMLALDLARSRGHDLRIAGRFREAYDHDEVTLRQHEKVFADPDDLRRLASHYNLSVSGRFLGRFLEAAEADRAGLQRMRADRPGDGRRRSRLVNALAEDLYGLGRYEELVDLLAPVVAGESGRELHRARRMTGVAFRRLGHLLPAVEQLGVCYQACLHQLGERCELTLAVCLSYGNALRELRQFDSALHYCRLAADGYATVLGERNPLVQVARVNTAAAHLARGDAEHALRLLDEAHTVLAEQLGERHPFTVPAAVNRASAAALTGSAPAGAEAAHAYELARQVFGPDHLDSLLAAAGLAEAGAATDPDQVLSVLRRRFGPGHALVTRVAGGSRMVLDIELPSA